LHPYLSAFAGVERCEVKLTSWKMTFQRPLKPLF
jgi:hypothetical protein